MPVEEILIDARGKGTMSFALDQHEMVVEVFEALTRQRRPAGISVADAYAEIEAHSPLAFAACVRVSSRMLDYVGEQMRNAKLERMQ